MQYLAAAFTGAVLVFTTIALIWIGAHTGQPNAINVLIFLSRINGYLNSGALLFDALAILVGVVETVSMLIRRNIPGRTYALKYTAFSFGLFIVLIVFWGFVHLMQSSTGGVI